MGSRERRIRRYAIAPWPEWRNGRRDGLKIRYSKGCVGSSPTSGTQEIHTLDGMGQRLLKRRLQAASSRIAELREELRIVRDQMDHVLAEAEDKSLRALVAETPAADFEYRDAKKTADAMQRHYESLKSEIVELEQKINDLLDRMKEPSI